MTLHDFFYGDETGTQGNARYLVLAGYIGSPRQWKLFDTEWCKVLDEHRVSAFHAIKFFQQASWQSASSPYHGWRDEDGRAFLTALLKVIDWHMILPIGCAVDVDAFDAQDLNFRRYVTGSTFMTKTTEKQFSTWLEGTGAPGRPPYQAALRMVIAEAVTSARVPLLVSWTHHWR